MKIDITLQERDEMLRLVDKWLGDTRVEVRRTRTPDFLSQLHQEQDVLESLHRKLSETVETPIVIGS